MKVLVLFIFMNCVNSQISFLQWQQVFNGIVNLYSSLLEQQAFDMNCAFINAFNSKRGQSFLLGYNEFSSLTFSQFETTYLGLVVPDEYDQNSQITYSDWGLFARAIDIFDIIQIPKLILDSIDYRINLLAVQNQKACGCCWAFAALSTLESKMVMSNSSYKMVLSPQYLVDCDTRNHGCSGNLCDFSVRGSNYNVQKLFKGGWPTNALNWILQSGGNGVPAITSYQYYGFKTKCRSTPSKIPVNIKAVVQNYTAGNENMMKEIVAKVGPVAGVISVTSFFQSYRSGVFYDTTCNSNCTSVNHAVVIVGYGRNETSNLDYWIVKNSWGSTWGQLGYVYMSRNRGNNCNIACYAMYAI